MRGALPGCRRTFWWWDDALSVANRRALVTGRRQTIRQWMGFWVVEEVSA